MAARKERFVDKIPTGVKAVGVVVLALVFWWAFGRLAVLAGTGWFWRCTDGQDLTGWLQWLDHVFLRERACEPRPWWLGLILLLIAIWASTRVFFPNTYPDDPYRRDE